MKKFQLVIKRILDVAGSLSGIVLLSPILLLVYIAIKLTSKGPALFFQERLGLDGQVFKIIKFRTMIINAEKIGDGLSVKSSKDPRITPIGSFLRKSSLDELPQLLNILSGDMSVVGPRPPVTYYPYSSYEGYPDWAKDRFSMKPGLTGLAQVTVRNSVSWDERIQIDLEYIQNFSILLDLKIILKTVRRVFQSSSIYMEKIT